MKSVKVGPGQTTEIPAKEAKPFVIIVYVDPSANTFNISTMPHQLDQEVLAGILGVIRDSALKQSASEAAARRLPNGDKPQ